MIIVKYLSTTLAERLINLSGIPSGPVALFALSDFSLHKLKVSLHKLEVSQNSRSMVKHSLLWLQHWDGFCKIY